MSTTDSDDPETEIHVVNAETPQRQTQIEPARNYDGLGALDAEEVVDYMIESDVDKDCIFPFIDLETAGNGIEDWEIFNIICGVEANNRATGKVSDKGISYY